MELYTHGNKYCNVFFQESIFEEPTFEVQIWGEILNEAGSNPIKKISHLNNWINLKFVDSALLQLDLNHRNAPSINLGLIWNFLRLDFFYRIDSLE